MTHDDEIAWTVTATCPRCGHPLRLVERRTGGVFIGCTAYPTCTFSASRDEEFEAAVRGLLGTEELMLLLARAALPLLVQKELEKAE